MNASNFKLLSTVFARSLLGALLLFPNVSAGDGEDALISISRDADDIEIKFFGVLQSAETVTGPWTDESGASPKKIPLAGAASYYRIKPFELPAAARFAVNLETGEVEVTSRSALSQEEDLSKKGDKAATIFAGSTIGFNSSVVLDEGGGSPRRKALSVSLVNQSGESVGEDPNGVLAGIKVIFDEIKNRSTPSDLRLQANVSTLAGTGVASSIDGPALSATFMKPSGVTRGPDGSIYVCDSFAHKIRKVYQHQVFTFAGSGAASSVDGVGTAASINAPWGIAYSAAANALVVVDRNGRRIRLLTLDGVMTTVAGTGVAGGNNGTGNVATFSDPIAVAVDGAGAIYVTEYPGQRIRKITLTGPDPRLASSYTVVTWAGGVGGSLDGIGTAARFNRMLGLAAEPDGTLYVADAGNFKIRRVSPAQEVVTIAGGGVASSVDGNGNVAKFKDPGAIALLNGSLAVIDYTDNKVRWLTLTPGGSPHNPADWQVRTLAGVGTAGVTDGRGDQARFNSPFSIVEDGAGSLIVADYGNAKLRKVTPTAGFFPVGLPVPTSVTEPVRLSNADGFYSFTTVAGGTLRPFFDYNESLLPGATGSPRKWAFEVPVGVQGFEFNVTVMAPTDTKVPLAVVSNPGPLGVGSPNVLVSTEAGGGLGGYVNGQAIVSRFNSANGIAVDQDGNVYVADTSNHAIRRIGRDRMVTTVAGTPGSGAGSGDGRGDLATFNGPRGVVATPDGKTLYVTDSNNHTVRRIVLSGTNPALPLSWTVATIAGLVGDATFVDGLGNAARFNFPVGITWAPGDLVYVTEFSGNRVRRLQPRGDNLQVSGDWHVALVAGSSVSPVGTAGTTEGFGTSARFDLPAHIAVDQAGNLYVADVNNSRIRKIDPNTVVSTLAGSTFGYKDGAGAAAQFGQPNGVAVDSAGYVYVADTSFHRIRRVSPAGVVTTVAGTGETFPGDIDGGGNVATFYFPLGIATDAAGALYVVSGGTYLFDGGGGVTSPGLRVRMIQRILR